MQLILTVLLQRYPGDATSDVSGGNGGAGASSDISGSTVFYAGGGGGGGWLTTRGSTFGTGGTGGGGAGNATAGGAGVNGTANTGGGGGGGAQSDGGANPGAGGVGGSGIVIISYLTNSAFTTNYAPTSTSYTIVTGTDRIDASSLSSLDTVTVTETLNSQTINYAVSFDGRTTFVKYDSTASNNGWRPIARNNSGTWQYNSNASAGVSNVTWTASTVNAMNAAISQAQGVAANNMTGTALSALTASNYRETGGYNSLAAYIDFSESFKTTDASQIPQVDSIAINYTKSNFKVVQADNNTIRLYNYTGTSQKLRLDSATASYSANVWSSLTAPTGNLALGMASYTNTFTFGATTGSSNLFNLTDTTSNTGTGYLLNVTTASGSTLKPFHVSAAGTEALTVLANGNVGIGTTAPDSIKLDVEDDIEIGTGTTGCVRDADNTTLVGSCVSDERLKKNITALSGGTLEKLAGLRPVSFEWRNDEFDWLNGQPGTNYGLIAQEVEQVFPEMINTDDRGYKRVSYDIGLTMRLLQAVKELYTEFMVLKQQVLAFATRLVSDEIVVNNQLCFEELCINKEQFRTILENNGILTANASQNDEGQMSNVESSQNEEMTNEETATSTEPVIETAPEETATSTEPVAEETVAEEPVEEEAATEEVAQTTE